MKKQFFTIAMTVIVAVVVAQTEQDDLYFSSRDRKMVIAARPKTVKTIDQGLENSTEQLKTSFDGNYSGRTLNPDYNPGMDGQNTSSYDYFNPNYAPVSINSRLYGGYGNSYQNMNFNYGGSYSGYYNYFYDPFYIPYRRWWNYDPFYTYGYGGWNPFYGSGCFSCMTFGPGFGWGSGWYLSSYYGGYSGWGFGSYYSYGGFGGFYGLGGGYYYPGSVVIINGDHRPNYSYGKRPSRSIDYNNDSRSSVRPNNIIVSGSGAREPANGRTSSTSGQSYYQRGWRQDPAIQNRIQQSSGSSERTSTWNSPSRSTWNNSDWNSGHSSRGSDFGSGNRSGGFSSGSHSSGSSSGSRRGRN